MERQPYDIIGNKLKIIREFYFKLTQEEMAQKINISLSIYSEYESGRRVPEHLPPEICGLMYIDKVQLSGFFDFL